MAAAEAWAIGFGMNARGAMEIILALLALQYGVISERVFVALVVLALVTSMMSGPMIQRALRSGGAGFSSANALERKRRAANV
jgi:Kef-type K+ transport system membrane component KefB